MRELAAFQRLQFEHVAADEDLNVAERLIERRRRDADRLPAARQQKVVEGELLRESNALHLRFFEVPRAVFAQRLQKRFDAIAKVLEALHERFFHDLNTTCLAAGRKVPLDERDVELRRHERLLVHQIVVGERKVASKARCRRFRETIPNEAPDAVNLNGRVVGGNHAQQDVQLVGTSVEKLIVGRLKRNPFNANRGDERAVSGHNDAVIDDARERDELVDGSFATHLRSFLGEHQRSLRL